MIVHKFEICSILNLFSIKSCVHNWGDYDISESICISIINTVLTEKMSNLIDINRYIVTVTHEIQVPATIYKSIRVYEDLSFSKYLKTSRQISALPNDLKKFELNKL